MKLCDRSLADALQESGLLRHLLKGAAAARALVHRLLDRQHAMHCLSVRSDRELADMGVQRKDIARLTRNGRPMGWPERKSGHGRWNAEL